ncbi:hypothetical protein [Nocardia sp. NPDC050710]|uniref:hypothetical protein n=1 Tax=Nocardia sp. NPDC050710 TaxID=3157220 RepID=UPI0033E7317F
MSWLESQTDATVERLRRLLESPKAFQVRDYAGGDQDFACWLLTCEAHCRLNHDVSIFDLPDIAWRDLHDDEVSPVEAVREAVAQL